MRERRLCVCARSRCDDDFTQNDERAEGELRGCFAKAARASLSFCCEALVSFFQSERERKERFSEKEQKKRFSRRAFSHAVASART